MIFTERTITIRNDSSSINAPVVLYRGDKNVEVRFTLVESPYKYSNRDSINIIESTNASYAQLVIKTPNDRDPIFGDITAVGQSNVVFIIGYDMIDEIEEVGIYSFQIRLFDADQTSMVTIPEVVGGFIIKEPIAKEDTTNNITNSAIAGSAIVTNDASIPTFVGGNYNKTAWHDGDVISRQKLDKIEDGIYETYALSKDNSSQIKEKVNKGEGGVITNAMLSQEVKEAMTGGSVAVVGKNTILEENIIDKQVTPKKTSFCKVGLNKFNIDDVKFGVFADPRSGTLVESENSNYYTVEIEVLPQTKYLYATLNSVKDTYLKANNGFICFLDSDRNLLNYITSYDTEYLETPDNCYYVVHSIYSSLNYESLLDRQPMFVLKSVFDTISNMIGNYIPYKYILNQDIVEVENNIKVINNLTSTDINNPLSANMGKELNEKINSMIINSDSPWSGKIGITYGDSITAINNPESPIGLWGTQGEYASWGHYVKTHLGLNKLYGRGIGGQTYSWRTNGGSVAFVNNSDGSLYSRNDNFNYDNYTGEIPSGTTKVRGAFCSWSRITAMIPESIKNTIDFIFVMGGSNDIPGGGTALGDHTFVNENKTDVEWGNSSYYNGGDFDINTYIGGMCSTIMKLQIWCPNAVIIVGTPLNGRASSNPNSNESEWCKNALGLYYIDYIEKQEKVLKDFGIPCIDVYGTCGINPFNRATYITDWVHPFSDKGCKALARTVIGGMKYIMPNI